MKFGLFQMNIIWEDKEANIKKLEDAISIAKEQDAELILLPEMSFTGFSMNTKFTKESNYESVSRVKRICIENKIAIGFGWVKASLRKAENHYSIIDSFGNLILDYIKIHPFSYANEDTYFEGGNSIKYCQVNDTKISTFICYDLRFPEIFQAASKEAEVIVIPANWPEKRKEHWKTLLRARAIENQVYMIGINCVGDINGICYSGDSSVINPNGDIILEAESSEQVIICEINKDTSYYRNQFPVKNDRKISYYKQIM